MLTELTILVTFGKPDCKERDVYVPIKNPLGGKKTKTK